MTVYCQDHHDHVKMCLCSEITMIILLNEFIMFMLKMHPCLDCKMAANFREMNLQNV